MAVQSMACPKCGKMATEYEQDKWWCLNPSCQIKFVYKNEAPTYITNSQATISISAGALYDINTAGASPFRIAKIPWTDKHKYEQDMAFRTLNVPVTTTPGWLLMAGGIVALLLGVCSGGPDRGCFLVGGLGLCGFATTLMRGASTDDKQRKQKLQARKAELSALMEKQHVEVLCPGCRTARARYEPDDPIPEGLTHCLSCGRQFVVGKTHTYPIKTQSSPVTMPPLIIGANTGSPLQRPVSQYIAFSCPECGHHLVMDKARAGQKAPCLDCGESVLVPNQ